MPKQTYNAPTSKGDEKGPIQVEDWLTVEYEERDAHYEGSDGKEKSYHALNGSKSDGKLSDGQEYAMGSCAKDTTDSKCKETTATNKNRDDNDGENKHNFNKFTIHDYTKEADAKSGEEKQLHGTAMHLEKNYAEGSMTNFKIYNNTTTLKIDLDSSSKESGFEGDKVTGGGIDITEDMDKYSSSSGFRIEGDFYNNSVKVEKTVKPSEKPDYSWDDTKIHADGGAIYVNGDGISEIRNSLFRENSAQRGGAIFNNKKTIGNISAFFYKNKAEGNKIANGGAIYNETSTKSHQGKIGDIISDFIGNEALAHIGAAGGGAIFNNAEIGNISGIFAENKATGNNSEISRGGAIFNRARQQDSEDVLGEIGDITGYFIDNESNQGGAIANQGNIKSITGYFEGNKGYGYEGSYGVYGGAISNGEGNFDDEEVSKAGSIGKITATFYNNSIAGGRYDKNEYGSGGAIANIKDAAIEEIEGDFILNTAAYRGGAIYNTSEIGNITGDFIGNKSYSNSGGAIANVYASDDTFENGSTHFIDHGSLGILRSNFYNNEAGGNGGAIFNEYLITAIFTKEGEDANYFVGNHAEGSGGAIYNSGTIMGKGELDPKSNEIVPTEAFTADFFYNEAGENGGAIANVYSDVKFQGKSSVEHEVKHGDIQGDWNSNFAYNRAGGYGGAIYNTSENKIYSIKGDFAYNTASRDGGAIYNKLDDKAAKTKEDKQSEIGDIEGWFIGNKSENGNGGAIYNEGKLGTLKNASFVNNTAKTHGGGIYTTEDVTIEADSEDIYFDGNTAGGEREVIYAANSGANITLSAKNGRTFYINDAINGVTNKTSKEETSTEKGYGLKLNGESDSKIELNADIKNADIEHTGFTTNVKDAKYLNNNNSLDMKSGEINLTELGLDGIHFRKFNFENGSINIEHVNVDLANKKMGRIYADEYGNGGSGGSHLTLKSLTVTSDNSAYQTPVLFANSSYANGVNIEVTQAHGPVFNYAVSYSNDGTFDTTTSRASTGHDGYAVFTRTDYNPAIHATAVAQLAGAYTSVMQTYEYSFEHADTFSALPASVRKAKLNGNKYAITEANELPSYYNELNRKGLWFRPYTSFENIPLKNGPRASNVLYGSYAGGDSEIIPLKNGWSTVYTGYVGYNGSNQSYQGNHTYQNGVTLGATDTFYKDDFYTAITMSIGSSIGETSTMFGDEDFTMLYGGVASRTGYNFEFNDGRFIIQPNLLLAYTFINTFDYTNAANVRIEAEPLHALQVHPYVKFIQNTESGWQPYFAGGFVYNVMGQSQVSAIEGINEFSLPSMSIKPYAEYGLGIQKLWDDKYTGFLQAMVRNGGRNGIAFTMGFRWALGDDPQVEKVQKPDKNIKTVSNVTKTEKPKKAKTPANVEKPAKAEKPVKVEKPAVKITPVKVETETPVKVENPVNVINPKVLETPAEIKMPQKTEKPAKAQQTESEEHHSFIYNWMLKFSNFFCMPSAPKTVKKK